MPDNAFNPLTLDEADFTRFVDTMAQPATESSAPNATTSTSPPARGLASETLNALASASQSLGQLRADISEESKRVGMRDGVFLNIKTGAPASVRARLGLDENQLNQFKLLNRLYGAGSVDLSDEGHFILRNQPAKGGGVEDVIVDPVGLDVGDVAQMSGQALPLVAGAIGAKLGLKGAEKIGAGALGKVAAGVTGMTLAQEGTGAIQDMSVRLFRGDDVNVSEIAKQRTKQAALDETLGFAFAGVSKTLTKTVEGALGLAQIPIGTTPIREAAKELRQQTGVKFPLTPGQETEAKLLLRLEAMTGERMGSSAAIDRTRAAQNAAEDELRRVFLGLPRSLTDEEVATVLPRADVVGQKSLARLGTEALRLEGDVAKAKIGVQQVGMAEAQLRAGVTLGTPISSTAVGRAARTKVVGDFDQFHADMGARYDAFLSRPEITTRSAAGNSVAAAARRVEKELTPQAERLVPGPLAGPTGAPILTAQVETLDAFVPAKVRGFIDTLKGLEGAKVGVNDLKMMRTSIRNAVKEGIAIPGTDVTQLRRLEGVVDDAITQSLSGMPNKALLGEWKNLTSDYAKGMQRFDRVGIREMLVKEGEAGAIGNTALAERIVGNSPQALDAYNDLKAFFGAASPEFQALQANARQRVLIGALSDLTGYIDGPSLRSRLSAVRPEVAQELFGANLPELHRIGEALSKAQGKLDTAELAQMAQSRTLTARGILKLDAAESARAVAYNNPLIKAAAKGTLNAEKIKPSEFVRYATRMDPDDASKVLGILSDRPELVRDIRQLAIEDIWQRVQAGAVGRERVSSKLLEEAMGSPVQRRTWRVILGNDTVDAVQKLITVAGPREFGVTAFKTAGAIGAGMEAPKLFMKGEVSALPEIASRFLLGFLYSGPLKRSVTNLMTHNDRSRFLNGVIASEPFVKALSERFGGDGAMLLMGAFRDMVEPAQKRALAVEGKLPAEFDPLTLDEAGYRKWLENNALQ